MERWSPWMRPGTLGDRLGVRSDRLPVFCFVRSRRFPLSPSQPSLSHRRNSSDSPIIKNVETDAMMQSSRGDRAEETNPGKGKRIPCEIQCIR